MERLVMTPLDPAYNAAIKAHYDDTGAFHVQLEHDGSILFWSYTPMEADKLADWFANKGVMVRENE